MEPENLNIVVIELSLANCSAIEPMLFATAAPKGIAMDRSEVRQEISQFCRQMLISQNPVRLCDLEATPKQEEFSHRVLKEELEHRERLRKIRLFQRAAFPVRKTLEGYEFNALRLPSCLTPDELTSCQFVRDKKNLVLYCPVGTGKTHLAITLGLKSCELGIVTRFFTTASLMTRLSESKWASSLERTMKELEKAQLIIIDEWGYLPMDHEEAQLCNASQKRPAYSIEE